MLTTSLILPNMQDLHETGVDRIVVVTYNVESGRGVDQIPANGKSAGLVPRGGRGPFDTHTIVERIHVQITRDHNVDTQYLIKGNFMCHSSGLLAKIGVCNWQVENFKFLSLHFSLAMNSYRNQLTSHCH